MKLFDRFKSKKNTVEARQDGNVPGGTGGDVPEKILEFFESASGGADLAKLIRTHTHKDIELFCQHYQIEDLRLDQPLSKDVNRFEGITILTEIIMDYERVRNEDPSAKLPRKFPHKELGEILIERVISFIKTQAKVDIAIVLRERIYDFALALMGIKDYRSAIECLKVSRSLKGDDGFWLAACYFNIANTGNNEDDIIEAKKAINQALKSKPKLPDQKIDGLHQMNNILKEKK